MLTGEIRFETTRVYGRGHTRRWACRAFVTDPKCTKGEMWIGRYNAEASRFGGGGMGVWDTLAYGCTDIHAIENFKREFAPEIHKEVCRAQSFNWQEGSKDA